MYLMCGPRQLFFFPYGTETPKSWTPLIQGTNTEGDEARIYINDLEHKEEMSSTRTARRKNNSKKMRTV